MFYCHYTAFLLQKDRWMFVELNPSLVVSHSLTLFTASSPLLQTTVFKKSPPKCKNPYSLHMLIQERKILWNNWEQTWEPYTSTSLTPNWLKLWKSVLTFSHVYTRTSRQTGCHIFLSWVTCKMPQHLACSSGSGKHNLLFTLMLTLSLSQRETDTTAPPSLWKEISLEAKASSPDRCERWSCLLQWGLIFQK